MPHAKALDSTDILDDAPEVSVRAMKMLLIDFERRFGRDRLKELFRREGIRLTVEYLEDSSHFVSFNFVEKLQDLLISESGDPGFVRKAAQRFATPESLGVAYYILRAFGNPKQAYRKIVELTPTFNRKAKFEIQSTGENSVTLVHRSFVPQKDRAFCEGRMAQFSSIPTIWGLPAAQVDESQCQVQGAAACTYQIRWQPNIISWAPWISMTGMGLLGLTWAVWQGFRIVPAALYGCLVGYLLGSLFNAKKEILKKDANLLSQNEGLVDSMRDLQIRHEELFNAKTQLETRVSDRTQALSEINLRLELSLKQQRELDHQKNQFFDNVSHEFRTPLTLILLSLEMLLSRSNLSPDVRQYLDSMDRSAARLLRLINHLLDLAKMEAGKARLQYQPVEMHSFLKSLLLPFNVVAQEKQIALKLEGNPIPPVQVDAEMIDIVFQNLVSNSLKFTSKGGVTVKVSENESEVVVDVSDTGIGMANQDLSLIFDRFAQADSAGIRRFGGTGIGLALVKETVELHGGKISVTSELGSGSTFSVTLPKGEAHIREDLRERRSLEFPVRRDRRASGVDPLRHLRSVPIGSGTISDQLKNLPQVMGEPASPSADFQKRVLLVEDDAEMRRFVGAILRQHYQVLEAVNGEEGCRMAHGDKPDLIVSDVMMPIMSGLQMVEALRAHADTTDIPVILLTARHEVDARLIGLGAGANDYLGKPFSPRELLARAETQLRIREAMGRAVENERLATMGMLSSGFAHEVRNPLNGLLNALDPLRQSLKRKEDVESADLFVDIIQECGDRVRQLAESLLSFARPSTGEALVDVASTIDSTLKILGWRIPPTVEVERQYLCHERVWGDLAGLNQVWLNLVDNAVLAMGEKGKLIVRTERIENEMVVSILDSGTGIKGEDMERIFQPFFSTRPAGKGSGLGLALCRRIVLRHGGRIQARSDPEHGTEFRVILPLLDKVTEAQEAIKVAG